MPEFRKDPVVDRWVIIAAERAQRPQRKPKRIRLPQSGICPFCAGSESMTPPAVLVLANDDASAHDASWSVRVVPNKYPALTQSAGLTPAKDDLYHRLDAIGIHEVVIETPKHVADLAALSEIEIERILRAYRARMLHLRADRRWQYILIYKNQGIEAGATLAHSHSQIAALPMVPREPLEEFAAAEKHYAATGGCIYCKIIRSERENRARIIAKNDGFLAFCPFASRVAGETWILPERHASAFELAALADLSALARILHDLLKRLAARFDEPAFNYFIHSNPAHEPENPHYHWHLELLPKLQHVAGFEWGSGVYMNSLAPEEAARLLRGALV
jgi:UDPglucose--hexose-1-phosphate uridylyltransferase